jgi:aryl-alcohol dehydrogenase-like predicted oxidoreductase
MQNTRESRHFRKQKERVDEVQKMGNTGFIVSEVARGTMQSGGKMNMGNLGQEDTSRMVKLALDRGINLIDTADVYSLGESEAFLVMP